MRTVSALFGAAGAGKTTIARLLMGRLGEDIACRISGDHVLQPADNSLAEYFAQPVRYDWPALRDARCVNEGQCIGVPGFDFTAFRRVPVRADQALLARPLIVMDAIAPYPRAVLRLLVRTAKNVQRERIQLRDARRGSHALDQWQQLERTCELLCRESSDLVLSSQNDPKANVEAITATLLRRASLMQPI